MDDVFESISCFGRCCVDHREAHRLGASGGGCDAAALMATGAGAGGLDFSSKYCRNREIMPAGGWARSTKLSSFTTAHEVELLHTHIHTHGNHENQKKKDSPNILPLNVFSLSLFLLLRKKYKRKRRKKKERKDTSLLGLQRGVLPLGCVLVDDGRGRRCWLLAAFGSGTRRPVHGIPSCRFQIRYPSHASIRVVIYCTITQDVINFVQLSNDGCTRRTVNLLAPVDAGRCGRSCRHLSGRHRLAFRLYCTATAADTTRAFS